MDSLLISLSRRAWFGSLLFHLVLLWVLVLLIRAQPVGSSVSNERNALVGILVKRVDGEVVQYVGGEGVEVLESGGLQSEELIVSDNSFELPPMQSPPRIGIGKTIKSDSGVELFASDLLNDFPSSTNAVMRDVGDVSGGGGLSKLRVFNLAAAGNNFVFVFDKSNSMNEFDKIPFSSAKLELLRNIQELGNNKKSKFNIIFYNNELRQWSERGMVEATELNCRSAVQFVQSEVAQGGTKHYEPLVAALRQQPDVIFFLTDGDDNDAMTQMQLADIKRTNQLLKVRINVIQFGVGNDRVSEFLKQLAEENNGQYSYINVKELHRSR
ncbi:MAG: VWA domain-containing protein [Planctomycetaceae bacterium]|jgi:hypothetical protein|nr:VWA domain-containing protein [Planctomycetaceae bacterium]